jgi:hypothetical protein
VFGYKVTKIAFFWGLLIKTMDKFIFLLKTHISFYIKSKIHVHFLKFCDFFRALGLIFMKNCNFFELKVELVGQKKIPTFLKVVEQKLGTIFDFRENVFFSPV